MNVTSPSLYALTLALYFSVGVPTFCVGEEKPADEDKVLTSADEAYAAYEKVLRERPPEELEELSEQRTAWFFNHFFLVCDAADRFIQNFPQDPRRWKAMISFVRYTDNLERVAQRKRANKLIVQALQSSDIEDGDWKTFKAFEIIALMRPAIEQGDQPDLTAIRRSIDELAARFPDASILAVYELQYATLLEKHSEGLAQAWLEHLARGDHKEVAKKASGRLRIMQMREEPVEMKFTALDGREVDLASLRGKVVLINFWATWCGTCLNELPNIRAVYAENHKRGFEVIGISLDHEKQKLLDFVAERKLPWPQFFDEENNRNRLAEQYAIDAVPVHLLLDQNGLLAHYDPRGEDLKKEVERLLTRAE